MELMIARPTILVNHEAKTLQGFQTPKRLGVPKLFSGVLFFFFFGGGGGVPFWIPLRVSSRVQGHMYPGKREVLWQLG